MSRSKPAEEIIPDGFVERHDADSVAEALKAAESAESTTPHSAMPRCPRCQSVRVYSKPGIVTVEHQRPEKFKCTNCGQHADIRMPPEDAVAAELSIALRLDSESERCNACGDPARVFVYDDELGVGGTVCFDHVGDMLARELGGGDDE